MRVRGDFVNIQIYNNNLLYANHYRWGGGEVRGESFLWHYNTRSKFELLREEVVQHIRHPPGCG